VTLGEQPADLAPHRRFLARWQERASSLRHGPAAAGAAAWLARSECACGGSSLLTGLERFAAACAACPLRVRPALDYATAVANLPNDIEVAVRLHHAITARGVLDGIEAAVRNGDLVVATATRQLLRYHGWQLALHCHDFLAVVRRTPEVHDLLPDAMHGVANDAEDYVRRLREQMQRR
jgi:hypothetical protein